MAAATPLTAAASAGPHTSAPRRRVEDRPRRDAGAHRRDLVVTTYAMLTRPALAGGRLHPVAQGGGIWWNPAVENQATDLGDGPGAFRIDQHRNVLVHKFVLPPWPPCHGSRAVRPRPAQPAQRGPARASWFGFHPPRWVRTKPMDALGRAGRIERLTIQPPENL